MDYRQFAPELLVAADGSLRVLTMNRPEQLNAIDDRLHDAMVRIWSSLDEDTDARVVILTGQGKAFSAGGDIPGFQRTHENLERRRHRIRGALQLVREMLSFHLPVIAAVNGPAVGLGCSVAVMADIVLMSRTAFMADTHVTVGLVAADGAAATFPLMTSMLKAKEYLFTGDRITAAEAERLGLANRVVEPEGLMDEASRLGRRLAELPASALQDTKRALNLHLLNAAQLALPFALAAQSESFTTDDVRESINRFTTEA